MTARSERGRCRRAMMDGAPAAVVVFPSVRTELGSDKKMLIITQQYESGRKGRPALPWLPGGAPLGRRERRTSRRWPADGPPMGSRWAADGPAMGRRWPALIRRLGPVLTCVSPAVSRRRSREHARQSPLAHPLSPARTAYPPAYPPTRLLLIKWVGGWVVTWFPPAPPVECGPLRPSYFNHFLRNVARLYILFFWFELNRINSFDFVVLFLEFLIGTIYGRGLERHWRAVMKPFVMEMRTPAPPSGDRFSFTFCRATKCLAAGRDSNAQEKGKMMMKAKEEEEVNNGEGKKEAEEVAGGAPPRPPQTINSWRKNSSGFDPIIPALICIYANPPLRDFLVVFNTDFQEAHLHTCELLLQLTGSFQQLFVCDSIRISFSLFRCCWCCLILFMLISAINFHASFQATWSLPPHFSLYNIH